MIPAVLALLGDNPMQSELACHIGLMGKFFCRHCWVKGRDAKADKLVNTVAARMRAVSGSAATRGQAIAERGEYGAFMPFVIHYSEHLVQAS